MAQLLIRAIDSTHKDPVKDQRGCWKAGDIVMIAEDDHVWGINECPPMFNIVKVPNMTRQDILKQTNPGFFAPSTPKPSDIIRTNIKIDLSNPSIVPQANALEVQTDFKTVLLQKQVTPVAVKPVDPPPPPPTQADAKTDPAPAPAPTKGP